MILTEWPIQKITARDVAALVTGKLFVTIAGVVSTSGAYAAGVSDYKADDGDDLAISTFGCVVVTAGAAISAGVLVQAGTGGKAITRTGTNAIVGTALTAATTGDEDILVRIPY